MSKTSGFCQIAGLLSVLLVGIGPAWGGANQRLGSSGGYTSESLHMGTAANHTHSDHHMGYQSSRFGKRFDHFHERHHDGGTRAARSRWVAQDRFDRDGDGVPDELDRFPDDTNEYQDSDSDGVGDNEDLFPFDPLR